MEHQLNTEVAKKYGILNALIIHYIARDVIEIKQMQITDNKAGDEYYSYITPEAFYDYFDYLDKQQINEALKKMIEKKIIKTHPYELNWFTVDSKILEIIGIE